MSATSREDAPIMPLPIPAEQFAGLLRVIRETVRQELRDEFEARRAAVEREVAEHQRVAMRAMGFKEVVN